MDRLKYILFTVVIVFFCHTVEIQSQTREIRKLQKSLKSTTDKRRLADQYNRLAMLSQMRFRDSCQYYSAKALKISYDIDYPKGIADALNCQGIYYLSLNNYLSAKYFNDALAIYKELGDDENQAQLLMNMGVLMFIDNNRGEARKYIYSAYDKIKRTGKDSIQSIILSDILTIDADLTDEKRNEIFSKGLATAEKYRDYPMIISYQNNLGTQLYNSGKKLEGVRVLEKSLSLAEREGSEYIKVSAYMTLGEMMLDLGRFREGIAYYQLGMKSSEKFGYTERYLAFSERLYNFYKERNDTGNAFKYAALLLSKQNEYAQAVKKSGYNYLDYVSRESLLSKTKARYETQKKLGLLLGGLALAMLLVVFFLWQALKNRKKFLKAEHELHLASLERNRELEISEDFNTMLISILAHDIREPFSNIEMISRFADQGHIDSREEFKEVLNELNKITLQGTSFMDGILLWIKSRKHNFNLYKANVNADLIFREANVFFEHRQKDKGITVLWDLPVDFIFYAPREIALFIFRNLLNNATKYTPAGGRISISASREKQRTVFRVGNTGKGLSREVLDSLFDLNSGSLPESINGGAGVALKISQEMMQKIGGVMWAESTLEMETIFFAAFEERKEGSKGFDL
ncbi:MULTISPECIES: sensor histidine kinase [Flavobacterium]|uniref:tetratricopeptide repeat-containing sensor histidine kinase n=1 Tax=Flavobacterium TaxID=237 RepID=UPI001181F887|nr:MULTISPECIES: HAMP domain-containing sensor histidine kinase [Flavobacterium]MCR4032153.1 HAMP domain-containing histidine kinase [Flavobacterium panacis]